MNNYRRIWNTLFPEKWVLGLILILAFGIPRFIIVLQANVTGQFQWVSIIFMVMWFSPLIFLTKKGRIEIGIRRPTDPFWLLWGFLLGCGICFLLFIVFRLTYGLEDSNAFIYIGRSTIQQNNSPLFFLIYLAVSMTFSPIGEELFYRGVVHDSFKAKLGERNASIIDASAFALTHLAHFGIIYTNKHWAFLWIPSMIWLVSTFVLSLVFNVVKRKSESISGAIITHAGFNFAMGFVIFYCL